MRRPIPGSSGRVLTARARASVHASAGSSVLPSPVATIWKMVSRLVARKSPPPSRSGAPQIARAWSRRQWPSVSSSSVLPRSSSSRITVVAAGLRRLVSANQNGSSNSASVSSRSSGTGSATRAASRRCEPSRSSSGAVRSSSTVSRSAG